MNGMLIVEDDDSVSDLLRQAVPRFFKGPVFFAASGEEALALWQRNRDQISVLFSDLTMPGVSGEALASRIVLDNPKLKVIISSGRPIDQRQVERTIGHKVSMLSKPYNLSALKECCTQLSL
jgi:DNA-binding NtrC family response regulator